MKLLIVLYSILAIMNVACSTKKMRQIEKVQIGMDRDDVLDIMGSPSRVDRSRQPHIWRYNIIEGSKLIVKEIHFQGHSVHYVGQPLKRVKLKIEAPLLSKEEKDLFHEKPRPVTHSYEKEIIKAAEESFEEEEADKEVPNFIEVN